MFVYVFFFFFLFYLGFLSGTFTNHRTAGEGGGHFINSSLPLPPASQALRHQPGNYCRKLTSAHSQQPDSNRESLVSERKSLTIKLRALFSKISIIILISQKLGWVGFIQQKINPFLLNQRFSDVFRRIKREH